MSNYAFQPKGRSSLPRELLQFGTHLIYSEGTRTEPYYVENIKRNIAKKYDCPYNQISIITATGEKSYNTDRLVRIAKEDVAARLKRGERIDHVWIFFDKDDFPRFDAAHESIEAMNDSDDINGDGFTFEKNTGISWHSCWSNECFELWLCLYFDMLNGECRRDYYKVHLETSTPLKKSRFRYEKNDRYLHDKLTAAGGSIEAAIKRARILHERNGIKNPSTGVYMFAEYFCNYMADVKKR